MKKIFKLSIIALVLILVATPIADAKSKSKRRSRTARTTAVTPSIKTGIVNKINAKQYTRLVANYSSSPYSFKGSRPALVDFNATWCGPCRMLSPILERLAQQYKGRVDFYSVDIDQNAQVAVAYGIEAIPTVIVFSNSGNYDKYIGLNEEQYYISIIESMLK